MLCITLEGSSFSPRRCSRWANSLWWGPAEALIRIGTPVIDFASGTHFGSDVLDVRVSRFQGLAWRRRGSQRQKPQTRVTFSLFERTTGHRTPPEFRHCWCREVGKFARLCTEARDQVVVFECTSAAEDGVSLTHFMPCLVERQPLFDSMLIVGVDIPMTTGMEIQF